MRLGSIALALACTASMASAATTPPFTDSVPLQLTNWNETLSVPQFDSTLGTLNSVTVTLSGGVEGFASAESLDALPTIVTLDLTSTITASTAGFGQVMDVLPSASSTQNFTAFDGTIDFAGTSGAFISGLTGSDTDSQTLFVGLSPFIGTGTVDFDLAAAGNSLGSGAGNLVTQFGLSATADLTVVYDYTPAAVVPLPAGLPLALGGIGALALVGRRRRG